MSKFILLRIRIPLHYFSIGILSILFPSVGVHALSRCDSSREKRYKSFKAGCLSANDGIFPDAFEDDIRVLFDEFERGIK